MKAVLTRLSETDLHTTGHIQLYDKNGMEIFTCMTLELPWKFNKVGVSSIPAGRYTCYRVQSPKLGICYRVENVVGRKYILIHVGNFLSDIQGCILIGRFLVKVPASDTWQIMKSTDTMHTFQFLAGQTFTLEVE